MAELSSGQPETDQSNRPSNAAAVEVHRPSEAAASQADANNVSRRDRSSRPWYSRSRLWNKQTLLLFVLVFIVGFLIYQFLSARDARPSSYFTIDDGATFFPALSQVAPFQHDGKEAVAAHVYTCDGGRSVFVGYLSRCLDPRGRQMIVDVIEGRASFLSIPGLEVKRPGEQKWSAYKPELDMVPPDFRAESTSVNEGRKVMEVKCPNGSTPLPVGPGPDMKPMLVR